MKFKIVKPVDVDIKYLDIFCGDRVYPEDISIGSDEYEDWEELFEDWPMLKGNNGYTAQLYLRINVENGHVDNWPKDINGFFETVKVVDEGVYILKDNNLNEIKRYEGYVPNCLEINREGYGDYWEFNINSDGFIENWEFTQNDVNELFDIIED